MPDVTRIIEQTATETIYNDDWLIKDSPTNGTTKIQASVFKAWINDGMATVEELEIVVGNIADTYNTSESYVVDDLCIHEYALYKCIGATTGTWDSTKWQATTIAEIIANIDLSAEAISYDNTSSGLEAENVQDAIDETITKLSAVGIASGAIATFNDGSDLPMPSLKVSIEPVQSGSGDPSPTNIRPISGWDECNVSDDAVYGEFIDWNQLAKELNSTNWVAVSSTATYSNGEATLTSSYNSPVAKSLTPFSQTTLNHVYYVYGKGKSDGTSEVSIGVWQDNGGDYSGSTGTGWVTSTSYTNIYKIAKTTAETSIIGARLRNTVPSGNYGVFKDINIIDLTQLFGETKADEIYAMEQAEAGSGVAYFKSLFYKDYYPYNSGEITNVSAVNGDTDKYRIYTIDLDGTRYGGTLDVISGVLTITDGYIASYNSEALPSTWISDRDVYAEGTTPTVGAEVVYKLATPQSAQLTPTQVISLLGVNNIWSDTGDVLDAEYIRDMTTIINSLIARIEALEN